MKPTWDAKHLDQFLASPWGEKFFQHSKLPRPHPVFRKTALNTAGFNSTATRESPKFTSFNQQQKPLQFLQWKHPLNPSKTEKSSVPLSQTMQSLQTSLKATQQENWKLIPPSKRKQLLQSEISQRQQYKQAKQEKLGMNKTSRIINSYYLNGVLGMDSPERRDFSPFYWKQQRQQNKKEEKMAQQASQRKKSKVQVDLELNRGTHPDIEFGLTTQMRSSSVRVRSPKRVESIPQHYHNTYQALFTEVQYKGNPERTKYLQKQWGRDFDIISGNQMH